MPPNGASASDPHLEVRGANQRSSVTLLYNRTIFLGARERGRGTLWVGAFLRAVLSFPLDGKKEPCFPLF